MSEGGGDTSSKRRLVTNAQRVVDVQQQQQQQSQRTQQAAPRRQSGAYELREAVPSQALPANAGAGGGAPLASTSEDDIGPSTSSRFFASTSVDSNIIDAAAAAELQHHQSEQQQPQMHNSTKSKSRRCFSVLGLHRGIIDTLLTLYDGSADRDHELVNSPDYLSGTASSSTSRKRSYAESNERLRRANWIMRVLFIASTIVVATLAIAALATVVLSLTQSYQNSLSQSYIAGIRLRGIRSTAEAYQMLYINGSKPAELAALAADLQYIGTQFDLALSVLQNGSVQYKLTQPISSPNLTATYESIEPYVQTFQQAANFIENEVVNNNITYVTAAIAQGLDTIISAGNPINVIFQSANNQILNISLDKVNETESKMYAFMFVIIGVLFLYTVFAYVPLELRMRRMLFVLMKQNESLNKLTDDLTIITHLSPNGIFRTDMNGHIIYRNERWLLITGLSGSSLDSDSDLPTPLEWVSHVHPDDKDEVTAQLQHVLSSASASMSTEFRFRRPIDGQVVWIFGQCLPETVSDANNVQQVCGLVGSFTDVTERKRHEQEKQRALEDVAMVQQQRAQEAEKHRRELVRFVDVICHEIRNPLNGVINNADILQDLHNSIRVYLQTLPDNDSNRQTLQTLAETDEVRQVIKVCANHQRRITDDVLSLSRLQEGQFTLVKTCFSLDHLIDSIVHMFAAEADKNGVELRTNIAQACSSLKRLSGDAQRLVQILVNLVGNAIKFTKDAQERRVTIAVDAHPGNASVGQLVSLRMSVTDSGIGMNAEEQGRLFLPFSQATTKTYRKYGGSGMGLFISKALIDLMGGTINVSSEPGKGTAFDFTVPCERLPDDQPVDLDEPEERSMPFASSASLSVTSASSSGSTPVSTRFEIPNTTTPSATKQRMHVLVVEDNDINQKVLRRHLEANTHPEFVVTVASDGQQAVHTVMRNTPAFDVIVMDVEMPVMDGLVATRTIRQWEQEQQSRHRAIIIGLSGNARAEHIDAGLAAGMNDYLIKPCRQPALIACLKKNIAEQL